MEDFNLIDNPWVWVTTTEGKIKQVSLHELFDLADQISCLSNENVYVNASIFLLCFSVLYTAYSRNSETKNMSEGNFVYRKDVITDYLQSVHDLFNLYDPERPFMQVKEDFKVSSFYKNKEKVDLQLCKDIDLRHLNVFDSSESKKSMWGLKNYDYSNDWIARQLVTYRQWHPNINNNPKGITVKASSFFNEYFSLLFIKGDTLSDQFCLNFKEINLEKDMRPIWEETPECENEYINNFISVFESKDKKGKISYSCYYDANLDDDLDVARLLTYSNVYLNINRNTNTFKRCYHLPIKLFEEKPDPDGKEKTVKDFSVLGSMVSIFRGNCNRYTYSIQKEILSDVYNETLRKAKYVSLIKSPTFVDNKKTSFKNLFTEPIILVGNGLLKVDLKDDVSKNRLRNILSDICDELESYDTYFKELAPSIIRKIYDKNDVINKETLYTDSIKSASLYAEEQFFEFSSIILDFLSDIPFLEKESSNMKRRIYSFYLKIYKQFIKQHCSKMYFCLDTTFNLRGISSMRTSDYIKIVSLNTYSCMTNSSRDLVKLRDMRHCKYMPTLTLDEYYPSGSKTSYVVGSKKSKYMLQGIQYALYLWSNHKYWTDGDNVEVVKDVEFIKDTTNYSNTFGGALGLLRKCYNKEDWENKCHKYEVASHNINNLVRFIYLTIKEMVDRNIKFKLDYGRLAYFFTLILENRSNIKEFCSETMEAFYKCKKNDKEEHSILSEVSTS